jgi:hypothetical protein
MGINALISGVERINVSLIPNSSLFPLTNCFPEIHKRYILFFLSALRSLFAIPFVLINSVTTH